MRMRATNLLGAAAVRRPICAGRRLQQMRQGLERLNFESFALGFTAVEATWGDQFPGLIRFCASRSITWLGRQPFSVTRAGWALEQVEVSTRQLSSPTAAGRRRAVRGPEPAQSDPMVAYCVVR